MTDADLAFDRYRTHGKPEDLARVFDTCAPQLLLLANHVAGDGGVAEDLVQLTFLRAIEAVDRFEPGREVQPWLVGILVREAKKFRRQASRTPDVDRLGDRPGEPIPDELAEIHEFQAELAKALDKLPQDYREVLSLRLVHGLTPTEIAHVRGVSPQTVKTQLRRGTERLRKLLPASLATVIVAMAVTGHGLSNVREAVLEAAESAAQAAAGTVAAAATPIAATAAYAALTTAPAATTALAGYATVAQVAGSHALRNVVLTVALGGAVTLGVIALDPFGGEPEVPLVEHREVIEDPRANSRELRAVAGTTEAEAEMVAPVDPNLIAFYGRVIGDTTLGLADIRVDLIRLHPDLLVVPASGLPSFTEAPRFVVGSATTDDRGHFRVDGVTPSGAFLVCIAPDDELVDWRLVQGSPAPGKDVDLGDLRLGRKHVMRGRITDGQGFPVAGVRLRHAGLPWVCDPGLGLVGLALEQVCSDEFEGNGGMIVDWAGARQVLTVPPWFQRIYQRILAREVHTDAHGRFEWVTSRTESVTLAVYAEGFARRRISFPVVGEDHDVGGFAMRRVQSIAAIVRDSNGDPLSGAHVMLGKYDAESLCTPTRAAAVTDSDGEFRVAWDRQFQIMAAVRRGPGEPWHVCGPLSPDDRITIAMPRAFKVKLHAVERHGAVRGPLSVRPVFRLLPARFAPKHGTGMLTMYQLGCVEPLDLRSRRTDEENGAVEIARVPVGPWTLIASAPGYASTSVPLDIDGAEETTVELVPLEPTKIDLSDPRYRAAANHPVYARAAEERNRVYEFPVLVGHTDEDGSIVLERSRWRRYSVSAVSTALGCCTAVAGSGVDSLSIVFPLRGVLEGRLTAGGVPANPNEWMVIARALRREQDPPLALPMPMVMTPVLGDGYFEFPPLEPGRWQLRAVRMPNAIAHPSALLPLLFPESSDAPSKQIEVYPRLRERVLFEALPPKTVDLDEKAEDTGPTTLHGTVRVEPRPVGGFKIGVEQSGSWSYFRIGPDGTFDTGIVPKGSVLVALVTADQAVQGGAPRSYVWMRRVADHRLAIALRLLPITFSLSTAQKRAANGLDVEVSGVIGSNARAATCRFAARTDSGGWFRLALPAGRYSLRGEHATHGWIDRTDIAVTTPVALSYRIEQLVSATGIAVPKAIGVDLPYGSEVKFVRIGGATKITRIGSFVGFRFRVDGLFPGKYRVTLRPSLSRGGAIVPPSRHKLRVDQGEIEIGGGGRFGIELRKPK